MKIVESGYKLDLHIHSCFSSVKDGKKVAFNTIENIETLVGKLNENGVQICAVTDHDTFGYDIYQALKGYENSEESTIIKVFPGVEFSVRFKGDDKPAVVHVIAIFDDSNDEKLKRIPRILHGKDGKPKYDSDMAFSEEKFLTILREIDIDTILIAHQKESLLTKGKPKKSDANSVGEARFHEFVHTEFFEAFEFRNKRNEIFQKIYVNQTGSQDDIRFITGSDCHDWRYYPLEEETDTSEFVYTYVKCLPTFRGLVMAITDHRRIRRVNSFFNVAETYIPQIDMTIGSERVSVPLSRGINVIIGDNSIGKSLLLHKLTGFNKPQLSKPLVTSYKKYLKNNGVNIDTEIPSSQLFGFDMQGEVRSKFEEGQIKSDEFLKDFYPAPIDPAPYREKVQRILDNVFAYLEEKFTLDSMESGLGSIILEDYEGISAESLTFFGTPSKDNKRSTGYGKVQSETESVIEQLNTILALKWLDDEDKQEIEMIQELLRKFSEKFSKKKDRVDTENRKIAAFQSVVNAFKQKYSISVSDNQKKMSAYNEGINRAEEQIVELVTRRTQNIRPILSVQTTALPVETNRVYNYAFNSRLVIEEINDEYINDLFRRALKKDNRVFILDMTREQLSAALPYYEGPSAEAIEELKRRMNGLLDEDFASKFTIVEHGMDRTAQLSAGFNAQIYFDLLSYSTDKTGVYIIDQPEDNISQKAIREYLLERFKAMAERRQVLIVTHNPQFIVNLDVDNVIFLGKDDVGSIQVRSGALEYKCEEYSVLDIISTHIEGGLDTLQRRWKRYEKNRSF